MRTHYIQAYFHLAMVLVETGRLGDAVRPLQICAMSGEMQTAPALYYLSWIMATHEDEKLRNSKVSLVLANQLFNQSQGRDATSMLALAAAYAEAGDFSKAVSRMDHALGIAKKSRNIRLKIFIEKHIKTLREKRPIRGEEPFLITAVLGKEKE